MSWALPYVWYPVLFVGAIIAFGAMLAGGMPLVVATYLPIFVAAVAIIVLEFYLPERVQWRPRRADVLSDATFMVFVQVLLPRILAVLAVLAIAQWMHEHAASPWWPHEWPLWAQVLAMVLAVDFMRYWVHRACHTWLPLWRLHEVHHSPDILYTLNVGRFHPLEKLLHFTCDGAPFLLLGVAPEVMAGYYLLYAVNGFFQHSNLRLRYGWLNYIVGSAETHRWHHARDPRRAQCNYGNTIIVWDLLFGTWYMPKNGEEVDIGIMDKSYPKGFLAQMLTPFETRMPNARRGLLRRVADWVMPPYMRMMGRLHASRISRTTRDPMRVQHAVLERILRENEQTTFGREHGFSSLKTYESYARAVPIVEFEALRPYIDAEIERGEHALTRETPIQYMRTSGSTGKPKDIPLTAPHLKALRAIQRTSVAFQYRACPEGFAGSILAIVSAAEEGRLENGKAYGAASGIVAAGTSEIVKAKFVLPQEVWGVADASLKYLLIMRLALARRDLTYFGSANSTTPLALMKLYRERHAEFIADVRAGGFSRLSELNETTRAALTGHLAANPARAEELARLDAAGQQRMADIWPNLRLVVTWTCGSAGVTVRALREELSPRTRIFELGYVSSEFRGTFSLCPHAGTGLPTFGTHFLEFAERDKWDRGERECRTLDQLRKGIDYYIIATTPSGLYRYFINDVVRVTGFLHATPLLKFVQKGKGVTNITGEKLYEAQVLAAVATAMAQFGPNARFVMMLADEEARGYRLYVEPDRPPACDAAALGHDVDMRLRKLNIEYESKRDSERLAPLQAAWLRDGTGDAYKAHCVAEGQREGQFKCVALTYRKSFDFDLEAHAVR